jgi:hypothetical protein
MGKKTLIAFSGLAWNLKSTIVDKLCSDASVIRLIQTNKEYLREHPDATPIELMEHFIDVNRQVIDAPDTEVVITDRSMLDHYIYDTMMNPTRVWQLSHVLHPINNQDRLIYEEFLRDCYRTVLSKFDKVLIVSLETSNQMFISDTFDRQPYSSTSYLFDNPDKYRTYSEQFNIIADRLYHYLKTLYYADVDTTKYKRLYFKFTEAMEPADFIELVRSNVEPWINKIS